MNQSIRMLPVLLMLMLVAMTGCRGVTVESRWYDTKALAEGETSEWNSCLQHIGHIQSMVGVMNDERAIGIGLVPVSREIMAQVAGAGCILWFNEDNPDSRYGIKFPMGDMDMAIRMIRTITKSGTTEQLADLAKQETELELIGNNRKTVTTLSLEKAAGHGIAASVNEYNGRLLLSVRVPFRFTVDGSEYVIDHSKDRSLDVLIETPTVERTRTGRKEPLRAPSGIDNDSYIRRGTRGSEQSQSEFSGFRKPINLRLVVKLAG